MKKYNIKKMTFLFMSVLIILAINAINILAADRQTVLAIIKVPIAGINVPNHIISQADAFLLAHSDIDYDKLEQEVLYARSVIENAVVGKEIKSGSDILSALGTEKKNELLARIQNIANAANVSVALDKDNKATLVNKDTGQSVFSTEPMIKATGKEVYINRWAVIMLIGIIIIFRRYRYYKI